MTNNSEEESETTSDGVPLRAAHLRRRSSEGIAIYTVDEVQSMGDIDELSMSLSHPGNVKLVGNLLPRLYHEQFQRDDAYPTETVKKRMEAFSFMDIRRAEMAQLHFPSPATLQLIRRPQFDKFGYSVEAADQLSMIAKKLNTIVADQLLTEFRNADRRRAQKLSLFDLVGYLEGVVELYEGPAHTVITRPVEGSERRRDSKAFAHPIEIGAYGEGPLVVMDKKSVSATLLRQQQGIVVERLSDDSDDEREPKNGLAGSPTTQDVEGDEKDGKKKPIDRSMTNTATYFTKGAESAFADGDRKAPTPPPLDSGVGFQRARIVTLTGQPPNSEEELLFTPTSATTAPGKKPLNEKLTALEARELRQAVLTKFAKRRLRNLGKANPTLDPISVKDFALFLTTPPVEGQLGSYLKLHLSWLLLPEPIGEEPNGTGSNTNSGKGGGAGGVGFGGGEDGGMQIGRRKRGARKGSAVAL